ncbi:hypothetical protein PHLCEN_2v661 [Hermanssonia centrifuga]|uniref:Uncharacterized protein n=1 Tax=Hermanssonia centrifuga TaxID=98765 RepID=A0A2R6S592_9APHY|nr:hypothetical protein PHLCEN_2v661 [Hermanssonia centrifuga]
MDSELVFLSFWQHMEEINGISRGTLLSRLVTSQSPGKINGIDSSNAVPNITEQQQRCE